MVLYGGGATCSSICFNLSNCFLRILGFTAPPTLRVENTTTVKLFFFFYKIKGLKKKDLKANKNAELELFSYG